MRFDPNHRHLPNDTRIFVFGSNRLGIHSGGAAWYARDKLDAVQGIAEGLTGRSYALPTCSAPGVPLNIDEVREHVDRFLETARRLSRTRFFVSEVGCGIAGFEVAEIAPMFATAPQNCDLPPGWRK